MLDFKEKYNREDFLEFLQNQFLPEDFVTGTESLEIEFKTDLIKKVTLLGRSDSLSLKIYEIEHKSEYDPRVTLTRETFRLMANYGTRRALVLFVSRTSPNYRFSLVTVDLQLEGRRVAREYSNPKRYSFFLGPDAKVHTPKQFLAKKGRVEDFEDLLSRFNVEVVTKEFFKQYRGLFEKLSKYLEKDHAFKNFARTNDIDIESFAKKLLGQIVFIYFLQRKGWLGAPRNAKISEGDKNFLRNLFNRCLEEEGNFFNGYLEHLFYDAFNKKSEYAGNFYRDYFKCQIPFLNGGLFEPLNNYDWKNSFIHIPNEMFSSDPENPESGKGILDIFELYNFTVYEDDPVDKEVSIDPEMLGKVFENLIEENLRKGKGTYYTPREIVHYMCQESLINYLSTETGLDEDKTRKLVHYYEIEPLSEKDLEELELNPEESIDKAREKVLTYWEGERDELISALKNIKVVDPACGSGAFLVGMLQEVVKLRQFIQFYFVEDQKEIRNEYGLKKETIQNCIYGVDIDPGAIEIAKLRLWLSLVVDYELDEIEPLPNLDYKIMVGNSLIELLSPELLARRLRDQERYKLIELFNKEKNEYFSLSDPDLKRKKREEINLLMRSIINYDRKKERDSIWQKILAYRGQTKIFDEEDSQPTFAEAESNLIKKLNEMDKLKDVTDTDHFEWHLNFNEVFDQEGGFNVVIANPPYITIGGKQEAKVDRELKEFFLRKFESYEYKTNYFALFIEKSLRIAKNKGLITYIVPRTLLDNYHMQKIRHLILHNSEILYLVELKYKIFESAETGGNLVLIAQKGGAVESREKHLIKAAIWSNFIDYSSQEFNLIPQSTYLDNQQNQFLMVSGALLRFLNKIKSQSEALGKLALIKNGINTGNAAKILLSNTKKGEKYRRILEGKNVNRYHIYWNGLWINYNPSLKQKIDLKTLVTRQNKIDFSLRDEKLFNNEKIIVRQTADEIVAALDIEKYITRHSTHLILPTDKRLSIKYLLALLNSKLITFYYRQIIPEVGKVFPEVKIVNLAELPIVVVPRKVQQNLVDLVDKIQSITKAKDYLGDRSKQDVVREYIKQIDQMVYKLYGLTPEEIKIVEA